MSLKYEKKQFNLVIGDSLIFDYLMMNCMYRLCQI